MFDIYERTGLTYQSKGYDTFSVIGPVVDTSVDPDDLWIKSYVNGKLSSDTHTSDMIFGARRLVSTLSSTMTLMPGDIVATGNSGGKLPISPGDLVEIEIPGIGRITNRIVDRRYPEEAPHIPSEAFGRTSQESMR